MASGKSAGRLGVVIFGGYDVSGDISSAEYDKATAMAKSTGMGGSTDESYVIGVADNKTNFKGFFDDTAAAGLETAMEALAGTFFVASFMPTGDTQGNQATGLRSLTNSDVKRTSPVAGAVTMDVNAQHSGSVDLGLVVMPRTALTGTGSTQLQATPLDNGALTSNGGEAYFHITALAVGTTVSPLKLQHSSDNITYADLATSGLAGTAIGADHQTVAPGTVNRYLKTISTATNAHNYTIATTFKRS